MFDCKKTAKVINANLRNNSAFANGEVREVREVKAICFTRLLTITTNDRRE